MVQYIMPYTRDPGNVFPCICFERSETNLVVRRAPRLRGVHVCRYSLNLRRPRKLLFISSQ